MLDIELEKQRCSQDFIYFVETYCKIQTPRNGLIKLSLNDVQKRYFKDFQSNKFNLILKQRQVGATTLLCAYAIWKAVFESNQYIIFVSMNNNNTIHVTKTFLTIINNLPKNFLKVQPTFSNKVFFEQQNSLIYLNQSTIFPNKDQQIQNMQATCVIFDEAFYFYKDFLKLFYSYDSVRNNVQTIVISTKNDKEYKMKFSRMFFNALFYMLNNKEK
jgi:hypothetical protein